MEKKRFSGVFSFLALVFVVSFVPLSVSASTFDFTYVQIAELFNIFVGLMLATAILMFAGGLGSYFPRLGTWPSHRDDSIKTMEWAVAILFVLVVILGVVQHFQKYPVIVSTIVGVIVILSIARFALKIFAGGAKEEGDH